MIEITPSLKIDESEVHYEFIRSSGPGGQNVNKVATGVQLRFDVRNSAALTAEVKERLAKLAGSRLNTEGVLTLEAKRHRTQEQNRQDATRRLISLIQEALKEPEVRKATRRTVTAKASRGGGPKKGSEFKRTRFYDPDEWE